MKKQILYILLIFISIQINAQLIQIPSGTTNNINSIRFHDGQVFFLGNNYLAKTYDYGDNLIQLNAPNQLPFTYALNVLDTNNLYLISAYHYPVNIYQIMHSSDGGINWSILFDTTGTPINDLKVNDNGNMIGVGNFGNIFKSTNGQNWSLAYVSSITTIWECESFSDSTFFIGGFNYAAYSTDLGVHWTSQYFNQSHCSEIKILNKDTLYMSSYYWNGWESFFSKSINGGFSWTTNSLCIGIGIFDIYFNNNSQGFAVGYNYIDSLGIILETYDSGNTWTTYTTTYNSEFYDIEVISDSIIFIVGTNGIILKSEMSYFGVNENNFSNKKPFNVYIFPNSATNSSIISISLPHSQEISLELYDTQGKLVKLITNGNVSEGKHQYNVSLTDISEGVYFYRIVTENVSYSKKLIVIK